MSPRVLIIDDEPDWQETFKDIFVSSGFEADTVAGTGSAKELLETTAYRLLVFDIFLTPTQVPLNYQGFLTFMSPTYPRVKVVAATGKLLPPDEAFALRELGLPGSSTSRRCSSMSCVGSCTGSSKSRSRAQHR